MLFREDWDFSSLPAHEYKAALVWEAHREDPELSHYIQEAKAWLQGEYSQRLPSARSSGKNKRFPMSDATRAQIRLGGVFQDFFLWHAAPHLHKRSVKERRQSFEAWFRKGLRPLIRYLERPWSRLPASERLRICRIMEATRNAQVVTVGNWGDAIGYREKRGIDPGSPLVFSYGSDSHQRTTVLLHVNWSFSEKRILGSVKSVLSQIQPPGVIHHTTRGVKHRDRLVALERFGIMRLLHHYTLAEIQLKLPDAWRLYRSKKWYDERRTALKEYRNWSHLADDSKSLPLSWETKATRNRKVKKAH